MGLLLIASNISGLGVGTTVPYIIPEVIEKKVERSMTVEEYVRNYFSDIPVMVEIARCESQFRQYDIDGNVFRGKVNNLDVGVMQINEFYHGSDSQKLGYDIMTIEGNTAYARYIFEKSGVRPWVSSSKCWAKTDAYLEYKDLATIK